MVTGYSFVDHVNKDGLDNRRANLRQTTFVENGRNCRKYITNKSGITGVLREAYTLSNGQIAFKWTALLKPGPELRQIRRSFSERKYGENARLMAAKARKDMELKYGFTND
jgi:hypothetical protein